MGDSCFPRGYGTFLGVSSSLSEFFWFALWAIFDCRSKFGVFFFFFGGGGVVTVKIWTFLWWVGGSDSF